MRIVTFLLILLCSFVTFAEVPENLKRAIDKLDYGFIDYKFTMVDDELMNGKRLYRVSDFNPDNECVFTLSDINGEDPTEKEIKHYSKDKTNLFGNNRFIENSSFKFVEMAESDEYQFAGRENGVARYTFINRNSVIADSDKPFNGELWLDEESEEILKIHLKNIYPIKVFLGIKVSHVEMIFNFKTSQDKHTLIDEIESIIYGNVLFYKIDYVSTIIMDNYVHID